MQSPGVSVLSAFPRVNVNVNISLKHLVATKLGFRHANQTGETIFTNKRNLIEITTDERQLESIYIITPFF